MLPGMLCVLGMFIQVFVWAKQDINYSQSHLTQYVAVDIDTGGLGNDLPARSETIKKTAKIKKYHTVEKDWVYQVGYISDPADTQHKVWVKYIGDIKRYVFLEKEQAQQSEIGADCYLKHLFAGGKSVDKLTFSVKAKSFFEEQLKVMVICLKNGSHLKVKFTPDGETIHETFNDFILWMNTVESDESASIVKDIMIKSFGQRASDSFKPNPCCQVTGIVLLSMEPLGNLEAPAKADDVKSGDTHYIEVTSGNHPDLPEYTHRQTSAAMRYIAASLHASGYLGSGFDSTLNYDVFRGNIVDASPYVTEPQTVIQYISAQTKSWLYLPYVKDCFDAVLQRQMFEPLPDNNANKNQWLRIPSCRAAMPHIKRGVDYVLSHELFAREDPELKKTAKNDKGWCDDPMSRVAIKIVQPGSPKPAGHKYFFPDVDENDKFDFTHVDGFDFRHVSPSISPDLHKTNRKHAGYRCGYTGLRFVVLKDSHHPDELVVAFSCMFASNREWHFGSRRNIAFNGIQLASVVMQLGPRISVFYPPMYKQALDAASAIHDQMEDKGFNKLIIAGYCLGGTIAQYVGGMLERETFCVNPFPLGFGLQSDLASRVAGMSSHVTNISIEHDWVSNLMGIDTLITLYDLKLGFKRVRLFGKRYMIPASKNGYSFSQRHLRVRSSCLHHAQWYCLPTG